MLFRIRIFWLIVSVFLLFSFRKKNTSPCRVIYAGPMHSAFADALGNVYILNLSQTEILKYTAKGQFINRYSNLSLGKIESVDVSNPLRILLFYRQRQAIVFLDNQLSQNGQPVFLEKLGIMNASMASSSSLSNGFWIFNEPDMELYRFNSENTLQIKSGNLRWFLGDDFHPHRMAEHNSRLYISDSISGIYVFDQFGTYKKTLPLKTASLFFANEENLWFTRNGILYKYNLKKNEIYSDTLPFPAIKNLYITPQNYIEEYPDSVRICP